MHGDNDRVKIFSRRAAVLGGGQALLLSTLVGRMYYLQVMEAERYATLAEENRISMRLLPPPRGHIVDHLGRRLAENRENYRVLVVAEQTADLNATLDALSAIIPISDHERQRVMRDVRRKRSFVPVTVKENLTWQDMARIEVNTPDLPGALIDVGQTRHYPHGKELAHLLGYVAAVSEAEQTGDPLLQLPGFRIGKAGLEKVYDLALRGSGGTSQVEVNAFGRVIKEIARNEGQPGTEVALTIDLDLQKVVAERLGEESAAAVVLDIHTGAVMAMVSSPAYDPNDFNKGLSSRQWKKLVSNPRAPLTNKAVAGQYAPGSTFKMVVALAALERGVITPETEIFCNGHTTLGNARFHCWKRGGHGAMNLHDAIQHSCDVYFYDIARKTGVDRIAAMAQRLGLGTRLDIDLPGERTGLIPTRDWKRATIGQPWQGGETLITGIGQGYVLTTPLQLAVMTARLANGGKEITPYLTAEQVSSDGTEPRKAAETKSLGLVPSHLKMVLEAMSSVVNGPRGTARGSKITEEGMEMAGKTGTAQVRRITKAERETRVLKNDELPWKERDHALFVGFAPVHAPRYAVSVLVEHGGGGSKVAAPIARDILIETQRRDPARSHPTSTPSASVDQEEPA
ncbi:penicillin-binding protein 2 [Magnetospira sp. QH-2]|uniref:penicillin-binding protein 2 n=1 Tax=Magnetospira sp. (strain QH-2) TaxID=1288970 RepID=UPI0003E814A4|nr:penicillin-binding protein 2 [Magnetospira sp. QH-2]CCQ72941.1 Peptidoglycan transpeptidase, penicillin binding protein MrdA [Magnetospira sp. QH-2]